MVNKRKAHPGLSMTAKRAFTRRPQGLQPNGAESRAAGSLLFISTQPNPKGNQKRCVIIMGHFEHHLKPRCLRDLSLDALKPKGT